MFEPDLPDWMDPRRAARIAQLRALGYNQKQIADQVGVSQQTVSRYLTGINEAAEESGNEEDFLMGLLMVGLGVAAIVALSKMFQNK